MSSYVKYRDEALEDNPELKTEYDALDPERDNNQAVQNQIDHMQVRLFQKAWRRWKLDIGTCAEIFDNYDVDKYIEDMFEVFHVQGDDANLHEIRRYLRLKGAL